MKQREIKFRAWDKEKKEWTDCFITMDGKPIIDCQGGGVEDLENVGLVQFTGLKDKNGNRIYEGDIVEDFTGRKEIIEITSITDSDENTYWGYSFGSMERFKSLEVIGNIYE